MAVDRPRLADVAARAGVSKKTVSNVVNEFPFVAEQTRKRVLEAISDLGYEPNHSARNLARGRTGVIALAIPRLDMPYFSELASHVLEVAQQRSWFVLIEQTMGIREREQQILDGDLSRRIDGLLFSPTTITTAAVNRRSDSTPMVLLGEVVHSDAFDRLSIDNAVAARVATQHLIDIGRSRIAAIGLQGHAQRGAGKERADGYRQALTAAGRKVDPERIRPTKQYTGEQGAAAMEVLLDQPNPPDAVFCFTDLLALGALRAIHRRGLRVPGDIAVVGFDDIPYGRVSTPALTTISPDRRAIAETAIDLIEQRLERRRQPPPHHTKANFELLVRESTAGA